MSRVADKRRIDPVTLLVLVVFLLGGCSGNIVKIDLPQNMVPVNDAAKKLHFKIPPGWQQAIVDPVIEKTKKPIRWADPVGFRKGNKGLFAVWCDLYDSNRSAFLHAADVVDAYAPQHELYDCVEVESPDSGYFSRPRVCTATATHVVKGEKKGFLIVQVDKNPAVSKMGTECTYVVVGASSSSEYNEEIKADIMAVAATLDNSGEYK